MVQKRFPLTFFWILSLLSLLAIGERSLLAQTKTARVRVLMAGEDSGAFGSVLKIVQSAQKRLWVFAYTLRDKELIGLLEEKAGLSGFDLRIFVDQNQYKESKNLLKELKDKGKLKRVSVPGGRQHIKLMLVDDHTLIVGSKNWSNLKGVNKWNDLLVIRQKKGPSIAHVKKIFEGLGRFKGKNFPAVDPGEEEEGMETARVNLFLLAPGKGLAAKRELIKMILQAKKRILVAAFVLSDPEIVSALVQQKRRGVKVRVVLDGVQYDNLKRRKDRISKAMMANLKTLDVKLIKGKQLHHKFALMDDGVVTGSANWSRAAWEKNWESFVILRSSKKHAPLPGYIKAYQQRHQELWELGR